MEFKVGDKMLVTTDDWFTAPNGCSYKAAFGPVIAIHTAEDTLGIETNKYSTNWYLELGNMMIGGCQIQYAIRTDTCDFKNYVRGIEHEGKLSLVEEDTSRIYNADV